MNRYIIEGGYNLNGEVAVSGSKNAALPMIAATLLNREKVEIKNCPQIHDVFMMIEILRHLGAKVEVMKEGMIIDTSQIHGCDIPESLMREMRSSVMIAGALIGRQGCARFTYPGGCEIGKRPINMHLEAFRKMGVEVNEDDDKIECYAKSIIPTEIRLAFPSVGATENIILASVLTEGTTIIHNAAREPEIVNLQDFINHMGGKVFGAGGNIIQIQGVKKLHSVSYEVIPDRIEAGTYLCMTAGCGGEVVLNHVIPKHIETVLWKLQQMNCQIGYSHHEVVLKSKGKLYSTNIKTMPYPGFPTDMQSQFVALLSVAQGTSYVVETIFENRFKYVEELTRMGAKIVVDGKIAIVQGISQLHPANVEAKDLRGGAALVEAALMTNGISTVGGISYLQRGYEKIIEKLSILGAKIKEE